MVSDENHLTMSLPHQNVQKLFTYFVEYKKISYQIEFLKINQLFDNGWLK
jgi:hypothetical protein